MSRINVTDVARSSRVALPKPICDSTSVTRIRVKVSGQLDGEATVSISVPKSAGSDYLQTLRGVFNKEFANDWYSFETDLLYEPRGVTTGTVMIEYQYNPPIP